MNPFMRQPVGIVLLAAVTAVGCGSDLAFEQLSRAQSIAADAGVQLARAADETNGALMAAAGDTSAAYGHGAEQAVAAIQRDLDSADILLRRLGYTEEIERLQTFADCFSEYRALQRQILALSPPSSDVRAFTLLLDKKGRLTQSCEANLEVLRDGLAKRGFSGTR